MADMIQAIKENIRILDYAQTIGLTPEHVGHEYWTLKEHDSVRINEQENLFYQHSAERGGSIIDFVMRFEGKDKKTAIKHLRSLLPRRLEAGQTKPKQPVAEPTARKLERHEKAQGQYRRAFAYLTITRGIDAATVQQLMKDKSIYEDNRGNVCFVGRDYNGEDKYGFARSTATGAAFRGDFSGSDKQVGFSINLSQPWDAPPKKLFVSESAIDSLSLMSMAREHGLPVEDYGYLSLSGVSSKALEYHVANNPQLETIYLCQDNDDAGNASRLACREALEQNGFDGKVVDKVPKGKDFNDDLCELRNNQTIQTQKGHQYENQYDLKPSISFDRD